MNSYMMRAFYEELEKIADWSVTGEGLPQIPSWRLAAGAVPEGAAIGPSLQQHILQKDMATKTQEQAALQQSQKMEEMVRSGKLNPSTHFVDRAGNVVPKRPIGPTPAANPTLVTPPQFSPTGGLGPEGTSILGQARPSPVTGAATRVLPTPARAGASRAARTVGRLGRFGRGALGLAALGGAAMTGYGMGSSS